EWQTRVVRRNLEPDLEGIPQHISGGDFVALPVALLIDERPALPESAAPDMDHQIAVPIQLELLRTLEGQADVRRTATGLDNEVVLECPLPAVVDEINPWIHIRVRHLLICRNVRPPARGIVADE